MLTLSDDDDVAPRHGRLWVLFGLTLFAAFFILGFFGRDVYRQAPPIPARVATADGRVLMTRDDILDRPAGVAVHRRPAARLDLGSRRVPGAGLVGRLAAPRGQRAARRLGRGRARAQRFDALDAATQAVLRDRLVREMRGTQHLRRGQRDRGRLGGSRRSDARARPRTTTALFGGDAGARDAARGLRHAATWSCPTPMRRAGAHRVLLLDQLGVGDRIAPGRTVTYTNNWPHEPLVEQPPDRRQRPVVDGQRRPAAGRRRRASCGGARSAATTSRACEAPGHRPVRRRHADAVDARGGQVRWPWSSRCSCVQVLLGALTAHYTVEGQSFFGFPLAEYLPYSLTRTWHIQTGDVLDRHRVPRRRPVPRADRRRPRAALPAPGRQRAVRRAAAWSSPARWPASSSPSTSGSASTPVVLVRAPGLRVRRPRPRLADRALHAA